MKKSFVSIKRSSEFRFLKQNGKKAQTYNFLVLYRPNPDSSAHRLGITVSTKIDKKAVVRNRIKRLIRESFKMASKKLKSTFDIVVIARKNSSMLKLKDVCAELEKAFISQRLT